MLTIDLLDRFCRAKEELGVIGEESKSLVDIAQEAGFSLTHFSKVFGETPHPVSGLPALRMPCNARMVLGLGEVVRNVDSCARNFNLICVRKR